VPPATGALSAVAQAGMFVFGIVMALIGAVVPTLSERLSFTLGDIGTLFFFMNFAMLTASLVLGLIVDRFGLRLPLAGGAWLVGIGVWLVGTASGYTQLLPAVACLGFGGGALNGAANTLVADLHEDPGRKGSALNQLGVFFGFGALALPFSLGALTSTLGLSGLLYGAAALCGVVGAVAAGLRFPAPKQTQGWPIAQMPTLVRMPVVMALAALLFFQSGNEFMLGGYLATFLTRELAAAPGVASYCLAGFWASIMIARIALSRFLPRMSPPVVVLASALLSAVGTLVIAGAQRLPLALAGTLLAGLALGGIFPTVLSLAGARFPDRSGTVFGVLFTIALAGGMTMPWLSGQLADGAGLRWVFVLAAANFVAVAALSVVARRV
jgi:FHS family glucose/mannose:H+ symporter-like MFS transporter